ncbi:MAG TPA: squalene--hopene cyclase [Steroidobacteraceae bacterium]|nr:squalene--hopene cyclase [Steroidobacteraceae bacterium]
MKRSPLEPHASSLSAGALPSAAREVGIEITQRNGVDVAMPKWSRGAPSTALWEDPRPYSPLEGSSSLDATIVAARDELIALQRSSGHWLFELEADCTIPAEYIMMMHFLGELDDPLERKIATHLRAKQAQHGGWPLYHGGELDLSCTVKAYFALKLAGDDPDAAHMARAREAILRHGGVARSNVFTRISLALFGELPWHGVPYLPVEIFLLPRWFPFHFDKVSYWSRTVMVPLLILCTLKPRAKNPRGVGVRELFVTPPEEEKHYFFKKGTRLSWIAKAFYAMDQIARRLDPLIPKSLRERATREAEAWMLERLNGEDGLGAIFPAMVNSVEVMTILGYPHDDPRLVTAKRSVHKLLVVGAHSAYCQPCVSPVWDSALASLAMQEEGGEPAVQASERALRWLASKQLSDEPGDWRVRRPHLEGGGWPFQFANPHYPDLDDTAAVVWAMQQSKDPAVFRENIERAVNWLVGMQSSNGGFAAFDVDNTRYYLNQIPFADHGALLDPPTSDVSARVVLVLGRLGRPQDRQTLRRAVEFLRAEQEVDGSWFGRWGSNYIYGTWSVLTAFAHAGIPPNDPAVRRAVAWLACEQNADGGWGESNDTYATPVPTDANGAVKTASTPFQTAWALLALIASGEARSDVVRRGVEYLLREKPIEGLWSHPDFTAPGFPRVFYLKYHGYAAYFPLWALAAYRNQLRLGTKH